jgi:hypothetical protein
MRVVPILATLLLVLGLAACGGGGGPSDLGSTPTTIVVPTTEKAAISPAPATPATVLPAYASLVARAHVAKLAVYKNPAAARPERELSNPAAVASVPGARVAQVFLVQAQRDDGWVQVQLPFLPEGTSGWVRDTDVTITQVVFRVRVELGAGRLTVFSRGRQVDQGPMVVDATASKTKAGHYYLRASFVVPASRMTASPFVYGLISKLVAEVPLGTPVDVVQ